MSSTSLASALAGNKKKSGRDLASLMASTAADGTDSPSTTAGGGSSGGGGSSSGGGDDGSAATEQLDVDTSSKKKIRSRSSSLKDATRSSAASSKDGKSGVLVASASGKDGGKQETTGLKRTFSFKDASKSIAKDKVAASSAAAGPLLVGERGTHRDDDDMPLICAGGTRDGWYLEVGRPHDAVEDRRKYKLSDHEENTAYYEHYFYGKPHANYVALDERGPVIISLEIKADAGSDVLLRALIRNKDEEQWAFVEGNAKDKNRALRDSLGPSYENTKLFEIPDPKFNDDLLRMEKTKVFNRYKFGVLYVRAGQTNEDDMFSNKDMPDDMRELLDILGERVTLEGFPHFRGGLDVTSNTTGRESYYVNYKQVEVMYHVSTLLPFDVKDGQKLERKRHLGNDVNIIVFNEGREPFDPHWITAEFPHVFASVSVVPRAADAAADAPKRWKLGLAFKDGVQPVEPQLTNPYFDDPKRLRDFLLTKLINSERSAMRAPSFIRKMARTRLITLQNLTDRYSKYTKTGMFSGFKQKVSSKAEKQKQEKLKAKEEKQRVERDKEQRQRDERERAQREKEEAARAAQERESAEALASLQAEHAATEQLLVAARAELSTLRGHLREELAAASTRGLSDERLTSVAMEALRRRREGAVLSSTGSLRRISGDFARSDSTNSLALPGLRRRSSSMSAPAITGDSLADVVHLPRADDAIAHGTPLPRSSSSGSASSSSPELNATQESDDGSPLGAGNSRGSMLARELAASGEHSSGGGGGSSSSVSQGSPVSSALPAPANPAIALLNSDGDAAHRADGSPSKLSTREQSPLRRDTSGKEESKTLLGRLRRSTSSKDNKSMLKHSAKEATAAAAALNNDDASTTLDAADSSGALSGGGGGGGGGGPGSGGGGESSEAVEMRPRKKEKKKKEDKKEKKEKRQSMISSTSRDKHATTDDQRLASSPSSSNAPTFKRLTRGRSASLGGEALRPVDRDSLGVSSSSRSSRSSSRDSNKADASLSRTSSMQMPIAYNNRSGSNSGGDPSGSPPLLPPSVLNAAAAARVSMSSSEGDSSVSSSSSGGGGGGGGGGGNSALRSSSGSNAMASSSASSTDDVGASRLSISLRNDSGQARALVQREIFLQLLVDSDDEMSDVDGDSMDDEATLEVSDSFAGVPIATMRMDETRNIHRVVEAVRLLSPRFASPPTSPKSSPGREQAAATPPGEGSTSSLAKSESTGQQSDSGESSGGSALNSTANDNDSSNNITAQGSSVSTTSVSAVDQESASGGSGSGSGGGGNADGSGGGGAVGEATSASDGTGEEKNSGEQKTKNGDEEKTGDDGAAKQCAGDEKKNGDGEEKKYDAGSTVASASSASDAVANVAGASEPPTSPPPSSAAT